MLALLELDLGRSAGLDDRHTARELGQALLQLLPVVVRVRLLDLGLDLGDPTLDGRPVLGRLDDRRLVLGHDDLASATQQVEVSGVELEADLLGDDLATGEDGDVAEHGLATVTEAGGLDGNRLEGATDLVDDQGRQCFAVDVLGDDEQRLARLHDLLQDREQVLDRRDLGVDDQDVSVLEDCLHPLGVGDEVVRQVALVEPHALGELQLEAHGVGVLDGDDAFLADLVHGLSDEVTDLLVSGGDGGGRRDLLLGLDVDRRVEQLLDNGVDSLLDAPLEGHRVGAGRNVAQALADHGLGDDGRRRRAVAGHVVRLLGDLLDQLGADLLEGVLQLDLLGDGHTIVGDRGGAPLLFEDDIAALGTEGHLDGVGEGVHSSLETAAGLLVERDDLGHSGGSSHAKRRDGHEVPATDGAAYRRSLPRQRAAPHQSGRELSLSEGEC